MKQIDKIETKNGIFPLFKNDNHFMIKNNTDILLELDVEPIFEGIDIFLNNSWSDHDQLHIRNIYGNRKKILVKNIKINIGKKEAIDLSTVMFQYLIQDMKYILFSDNLDKIETLIFWYDRIHYSRYVVDLYDIETNKMKNFSSVNIDHTMQYSTAAELLKEGKYEQYLTRYVNDEIQKKLVLFPKTYKWVAYSFPEQGLSYHPDRCSMLKEPSKNYGRNYFLFGNSEYILDLKNF